MRIGEVVRQSGIPRDTITIRYYERMGLLRAQGRSTPTNRYKTYAPDTLTRLELIRQAKKLGFSLTEIADGLELLFRKQLSDVAAEDQLSDKTKVLDKN